MPSGVSVGIHGSIDELLAAVEGYLADGYVRIKLKIEPGWDLEPVAAVRRADRAGRPAAGRRQHRVPRATTSTTSAGSTSSTSC